MGVATLKQQFTTTFSALAELGISDIAKRLEASLPPRGLQEWTADYGEKREGLTRSELQPASRIWFDQRSARMPSIFIQSMKRLI